MIKFHSFGSVGGGKNDVCFFVAVAFLKNFRLEEADHFHRRISVNVYHAQVHVVLLPFPFFDNPLHSLPVKATFVVIRPIFDRDFAGLASIDLKKESNLVEHCRPFRSTRCSTLSVDGNLWQLPCGRRD